MKAVMISIQPKWCELIASGKKTVEVRKTKPKLETPFKVYIYQTKMQWVYSVLRNMGWHKLVNKLALGTGKVIGEFVCECVTSLKADNIVQAYYNNTQATCLTDTEIKDYANGGKLYYWHISDPVIYDKPRELNEFHKPTMPTELRYENDIITRPPQSWCYVESEGEGNDKT